MEIKVREVEKILEFIALNGYDAVTKANEGIDSIKKWQQVSIDEIHQFASVIKRIEEPAVRKMLKSELHSRKLLYKNSLRAMMKRRRFYKAVKDFFSWQQYTYYRQCFNIAQPDRAELADTIGWEEIYGDLRMFILTTPFKLYGKPMQFIGHRLPPWMETALKLDAGYEIHAVKFIPKDENKA
jgi:hypothetical protein